MEKYLWVDDRRPAPDGYTLCKSTNEAVRFIKDHRDEIVLIDLDHDSGDYHYDGGDYINVLGELERLSFDDSDWADFCYRVGFRLHSQNAVGLQNMRAILWHHGWQEVL